MRETLSVTDVGFPSHKPLASSGVQIIGNRDGGFRHVMVSGFRSNRTDAVENDVLFGSGPR